MRTRTILLGLAGLGAAVVLGLAGYLVSRETIALPATSLAAGDRLAPARTRTADALPAKTTTTRRTTTTRTTRATPRPVRTDDHGGGDDNSGKGSGGSGGGGHGRGGGGGDDD